MHEWGHTWLPAYSQVLTCYSNKFISQPKNS